MSPCLDHPAGRTRLRRAAPAYAPQSAVTSPTPSAKSYVAWLPSNASSPIAVARSAGRERHGADDDDRRAVVSAAAARPVAAQRDLVRCCRRAHAATGVSARGRQDEFSSDRATLVTPIRITIVPPTLASERKSHRVRRGDDDPDDVTAAEMPRCVTEHQPRQDRDAPP